MDISVSAAFFIVIQFNTKHSQCMIADLIIVQHEFPYMKDKVHHIGMQVTAVVNQVPALTLH